MRHLTSRRWRVHPRSWSRARRRRVAELCCKHCGSGTFVRNGMANGRQRYRCKACGRNFPATPARGKPPAMKALAVLLYALGNVSQGMIAKLLGGSHVAELGGRDDATCRRLLGKAGIDGRAFVTDDWEGFQRLIPAEQLFTGKDLTFPIEQDNSNIRHHLARFPPRSKVTSRARHLVDGALRLLCRLRHPENFLPLRGSFLSIFS